MITVTFLGIPGIIYICTSVPKKDVREFIIGISLLGLTYLTVATVLDNMKFPLGSSMYFGDEDKMVYDKSEELFGKVRVRFDREELKGELRKVYIDKKEYYFKLSETSWNVEKIFEEDGNLVYESTEENENEFFRNNYANYPVEEMLKKVSEITGESSVVENFDRGSKEVKIVSESLIFYVGYDYEDRESEYGESPEYKITYIIHNDKYYIDER